MPSRKTTGAITHQASASSWNRRGFQISGRAPSGQIVKHDMHNTQVLCCVRSTARSASIGQGDASNDEFDSECSVVADTNPVLHLARFAELRDRALPAIQESVSRNCPLLTRQPATTALDWLSCPYGAETSPPTSLHWKLQPVPCRVFLIRANHPRQREMAPAERRALRPSRLLCPTIWGGANAA